MNLYITLAELKAMGPCVERYRHLMRNIEYDKSVPDSGVRIPVELIYEVNGSDDFEWTIILMRTTKGLRQLGLKILNSPEWDRYLYCPRDSEEEGRAIGALCRKFQRK